MLHAPHTDAGAACDIAIGGCIVQDLGGARVDVVAAISVAGSLGVAAAVAASMVMAAAKGLEEGLADGRQRDKGEPETEGGKTEPEIEGGED